MNSKEVKSRTKLLLKLAMERGSGEFVATSPASLRSPSTKSGEWEVAALAFRSPSPMQAEWDGPGYIECLSGDGDCMDTEDATAKQSSPPHAKSCAADEEGGNPETEFVNKDCSGDQDNPETDFVNKDCSGDQDADNEGEKMETDFVTEDNIHEGPDFNSDDSVADPTYTLPQMLSTDRIRGIQVNVLSPRSSPKKTRKMPKHKKRATVETAKKLRNEGKSYVSTSTKKVVKGKAIGPTCKETCHFQCSKKIDAACRESLFNSYWSMGNLEAQRNYILKSIDKITPKIRYTNKAIPREWNHAFSFRIGSEKVRVCKLFFMNTLGISDRPIRTVLSKTDKMGFLHPDKRGKHGKHHTVDENLKTRARAFIQSIPRIESHYLRSQTTREFIDAGRSLADIYRDFVKFEHSKGFSKTISDGLFREIFNKEFNISFFTPKKDLCGLCEKHKNCPESEEIALQYEEHQYQKVLSRISKELDKDAAATNSNEIVCCFDLQAVMPSPKGNVSLFYYKSKVNSYNFTVTNINTGDTSCYFWHEGEANRGANEIGSCLYKYLAHLNSTLEEECSITFYSDNCCGQNKNRFIMAMFVYAVCSLKNIKSITHKFLICGHTQNEGDSAHSIIEKQVKKSLKKGGIYLPYQYVPIIREARKNGKGYDVFELTSKDFQDMKDLKKQVGPNFEHTVSGRRIKMSDIKIARFEGRNSYAVATSYDEELEEVEFNKKKTTQKLKPKAAYKKRPGVPENKKKDIRDLISEASIPPAYGPLWETLFA